MHIIILYVLCLSQDSHLKEENFNLFIFLNLFYIDFKRKSLNIYLLIDIKQH